MMVDLLYLRQPTSLLAGLNGPESKGVANAKEGSEMSIERPIRSVDQIHLRNIVPSTSRRSFLAGAGGAAAALLGGRLAGIENPLVSTALAAGTGSPTPTYAPIPEGALGPPLNTDGYFVGRISGDLYWVTDSFYIAMFLTTRDGVVLVDAPPTIGHNLLRAISAVTAANHRPSRVTHLVYSHSHADHIGASSLFGSDVVRVGHRLCCDLLLRDNDPLRPPPTVTFEDHFVLRVGGERLHLDYHGPNHSPDNIFIHAPDHQTLMLVDVIFPGWVPFDQLAVSQDIPDWIKAQQTAMGFKWQTLVAGHLGRLGTRADGELQIAYVNDLVTSAKATIASLDPTPFFQQFGNNAWAIFKAYLDAASAQTAAPVTEKYLGKLAAADVYTVSNAFSIFEFALRVDGGVLGPFGVHP
jgi:glyoxylase-like metal-dependent hydrolase (beta-lactamase superfamily II)